MNLKPGDKVRIMTYRPGYKRFVAHRTGILIAEYPDFYHVDLGKWKTCIGKNDGEVRIEKIS